MVEMIRVLAALSFVLAASDSRALVVDQDWQTPGDAKLLLDTDTGLRWLDLSMTANMSHDMVAANLQPGGVYEGFRLATQAEVLTLWSDVGIFNTERDWVTNQYGAVRNLVNRLGPTVMLEVGLFPLATHTIGMVEGGSPLTANARWAMELTYAPDGLSTRTSANHYTWFTDAADEHYSTYLVAVPEASVFPMMLAGLSLVGFVVHLRTSAAGRSRTG